MLAAVLPGDFLGELALYDRSPRSARATAAVPTRLARVDESAFDWLRKSAPLEIASTLADRTIGRVRQTNTKFFTALAATGQLSRVGTELGTLSHNLRIPLATIRSAADILEERLRKESSSHPDTLRFVEIIRGTADRGLAQIDHLMARLRGEGGDERQRVTAASLITGLREIVDGYLRNPALRYDDSDRDLTEEVLAALANIVKNAFEALPAGEGDVQVSVRAEAQYLVFSVSDTGPSSGGARPRRRALTSVEGLRRYRPAAR